MDRRFFTSAVVFVMAVAFFASCGVRKNTRTMDEGVVINGIRWATRNVDMPGRFTENPEDFGMLFQWNRRQAWSSANESIQNWNYSIPTGTMWYAQNDPCPRGWRVPTREELESLAKAHIGWTTKNGVNGGLFGTADSHIFLSAVGSRNADGTRNTASINYWGFYSSATQYDERLSWRLQFSHNRNAWVHRNSSRVGGFPVRCVAID